MTIEHLLEISADELEKMSDAQLMEFFQPYLQYVRPETGAVKRESKALGTPKTQSVNASIEANIAKAKAIAAKFGIDIEKL